jgi:hypothetical protein
MEMQAEDLDCGITNLVLRGRLGTVGASEIEFPFNAAVSHKSAIVVDLSQVDFCCFTRSPPVTERRQSGREKWRQTCSVSPK